MLIRKIPLETVTYGGENKIKQVKTCKTRKTKENRKTKRSK